MPRYSSLLSLAALARFAGGFPFPPAAVLRALVLGAFLTGSLSLSESESLPLLRDAFTAPPLARGTDFAFPDFFAFAFVGLTTSSSEEANLHR